ncbi:ribonuclease J [uncultured Propionibacterium sp.]|uniref:ribonuclease J n=1 Tax=uncultured Propionibacterium sp. TaxID=218066 RepID=UPI00292F3A3B|nr:ribonuclease J [uncultured Propionibacterium sp.]
MAHDGLKTPPRLRPNTLRVIPLGGLGDVGRNMTCFELDGRILIIDCGVLFPEESQPGVDLILPGLDYLADRLDDVVGLVLTHGHEDHIGGVPYLLRQRRDIPVYGSRLTLALVEAKLREHRLRECVLRTVTEGEKIELGEFAMEFFAVTHSIPDALAVVIRTPAGSVLHTGDFKMDQLPLDGRITDLRGFARAGEEGIDLLLADSTNAEVRGFTPLERDILPNLERVFAEARRKLVVACFASHVHRVQEVLDLAARHGRKVCYIGRSMVRNMSVARDLGYLHVPGDILIEPSQLADHPDDRVVVICTGSQGEPLAALSRIANRDHPVIGIGPGDTVLFASSLIPGNENSVYRVVNGLTRLGARVVHRGNAFVHVSGHSASGELLYLYNIVKPGNAMPVHGEERHLVANAELAIATGVPRDRAIVARDGDVVDLRDGAAGLVGRVDASYIFVDGSTVGDVSESSLTDRRILGEEGFISIVAAVDLREGEVIAGPDVSARGFLEDPTIFDDVTKKISQALAGALDEGVDDEHRLQQVVRRTVGQWVSSTYRRRPMIVPVVIAV